MTRSLKTRIRFLHVPGILAAGVCLVVGLARVGPATGFQVIGVQAKAEPADYYGPCPTTIHFVGIIKADGPGTVAYRWEHSPGTGNPQSVVLNTEGTGRVIFDQTGSTSDFLSLVTDSPNTKGSMAAYKILCQEAGPKTDLTLPSLSFKSWGACAAGKTLFTLSAKVKNIGLADFNSSVRIVATDGDWPGWFSIGVVSGPIAANGGEATVDIPVAYPSQPNQTDLLNHLLSVATHVFNTKVDDLQVLDEASESNNLSPPLDVAIKAYCTTAKMPPAHLYKKKVPIRKPDSPPVEKPLAPIKPRAPSPGT